MTEKESHIEVQQETHFLPITEGIVTIVLADIAEDPERAIREEEKSIEGTNQTLMRALTRTMIQQDHTSSAYTDGALFAHKLLRTQAEARGVSLPFVPTDTLDAHLRDVEELLTGKHLTRSGLGKEQLTTSGTTDPYFERGITELAKYNPIRHFSTKEV